MSLLLLFTPPFRIELSHRRIPIIISNTYQLSFRMRSSVLQTATVRIDQATGFNPSLVANPTIKTVDEWKLYSYEFTGAITDNDSYLRIIPDTTAQNFYVDRFRLINLTKERKQYRIMRIQGSLLTGSFVQSLTLREVSAQETA